MAYSNSNDLQRRSASEKILYDKGFAIANNQQYDGYQREFASMNYKCFDKNRKGSIINGQIASTATPNNQLGDELHKPIIKKFEKLIFLFYG